MSTLATFLDPYLTDWLNLLLRWLHVIAAMAWIGASFYFVLLDQSLEAPKTIDDIRDGVGGELWEVHGGGFYHVKKYRVAPPLLPEHLAWFKWEAYTTWLSGFGLMVVLYYFNASAYLIDPQVADLSSWQAVGISVGLLAAAWVVYDVLCRGLVGSDVVVWLLIVAFTAAAAWGSTQLFQPRAAFLQVGAMLGTIMAGNVFFNIIPAHWELIRAKRAGRDPDPTPGIVAKQRSVHNNYFTLPVLFTMIAGHVSFTYGARHAWLVLLVIMFLGAWARLFFNLRHQGRTIWTMPAIGAVIVLALALALRPGGGGGEGATAAAAVTFAQVQPVIQQRCAGCHSLAPTQPGFASPPAGLVLTTPAQIAARAADIRRLVASKAMPLGNVTGMTSDERALVIGWVEQGAPTGG
ncbi:hypothetical protein Gocc_3058 [Gaiella occulta]|uniref:Cytochrome c domain-containing protein n=1 Tax=Gaiella occulta TaxID=1002870 RepID=A0A7M2YSX2_9ACTN|nr:urate hydroxylase PuuD [Gaiella occulta]RDI73263.1 hypothetical protein Gocc_3058 [Gaiella occulta]